MAKVYAIEVLVKCTGWLLDATCPGRVHRMHRPAAGSSTSGHFNEGDAIVEPTGAMLGCDFLTVEAVGLTLWGSKPCHVR